MATIGRYEIESRIGRGGMGDVYRAYDPTLRRRVAIKVLKVEGDAETLNRFRLEATAAGNLNHANIVTVHDYGVVDNEPYLVMEYLEGEDLQRTIESGKKFELVEITDIMSQVSDALECAHLHGVIHRDVKPANIMLLNKGGVKLMDFGIARLAGSNTQHTKAGHLIGTVLYMSPEQFHNMELDLRVDIWAYGVIYYELLAGKNPFQVPDQIVTMYNIANKQAAPICSVNSEIPEALGQIVDRCLAKDRDQRYRSMEDLRYDILPVLQDLSKQQAARMLGQAQIMIDRADWDSAQVLIRRVLELDPADRAAHALRKNIADAVKRRELGPRIESLGSTAEQHIAAKEYLKALEAVETVLRLDPTQNSFRQKAEQIKDLIDRERRAAEALRAAKSELETRNLTAAYQHAAEAVRINPDLSEGTRLLATLQEEFSSRERQKNLGEGLAAARTLLRNASYDDAATLLKGLAAQFPGTLEVTQLLREAETAREAEKQRRLLQTELAGVKEQLGLQRFATAVQSLEKLIAVFPGQVEVQELLRYAREEWKVQQRSEALYRFKEQVGQLQNEGKFDEALIVLERSQVEFSDEPDLARLAQAVAANKAEADRRSALEQALLEAQTKRRSADLTGALRVVDGALRQFGPDENLNSLRGDLDLEWQKLQRARTIEGAVAEGRQFLERREWGKAIAFFQNLARQYPDASEPRKLLLDAENSLKLEERQRAEADGLARAGAFEQQGQRESALSAVEGVLKAYPDSATLLKTKERLSREIGEERKAREREAKLEESRRKAQAEQQRRVQEAEQAAETQRQQRTAKVEDCLSKAYLAMGQGDLSKASKLIAEAQKTDSSHPGVASAQRDLEAAGRASVATGAQQPRPVAEEPKPFPVKAVAIGTGVAGVIAAGVFMLLSPKSSVPTIPFEATPSSFEFTYKIGGSAPEAVNVTLKGTTGSKFSAKSNDPWLTFAPEQGTLPATISLIARPAGLSQGRHNSMLEVSQGQSLARVAVSLTVNSSSSSKSVSTTNSPVTPPTTPDTPRRSLNLAPDSLSFTWVPGSAQPASKTIGITGSGRFDAEIPNVKWASVSPEAGSAPGQIKVTVHPEQLTAGSSGGHTCQLIVTSPDFPGLKKVATIRLVVEEAGSGTQKPAAIEPKTVTPPVAEEKKPAGGIFLGGARSGDLVWSGTLAPGGKVVIGPGGVSQGGGKVVSRLTIPRDVAFDVSGLPAGVQASVAINTLTLTNLSPTPISTITAHWAVK